MALTFGHFHFLATLFAFVGLECILVGGNRSAFAFCLLDFREIASSLSPAERVYRRAPVRALWGMSLGRRIELQSSLVLHCHRFVSVKKFPWFEIFHSK